ncbi:hypothetical protein pb186bvf_009274 [Paramecium bursaria]
MQAQNRDKFETSFVYLFKYIIIGDTGVGKSCLLLQFIDKRFRSKHDVTIGVEFGARIIKLQNQNIKLSIWDTAGQESFRSITRSYYRSAAAAIIVYDISRRDSFVNVTKWLEEAKQNGNTNLTFLLVGNKSDLEQERQVSFEEAKQFAHSNDIGFMETSAKSNHNVDQMFQQTAELILFKINKGLIDPRNEQFGVRIGSEYKAVQTQESPQGQQGQVQLNQPTPKKKEKEGGCC